MSELVIIRVDFAKLNGQVCQVQRKKLRNFSINAQQRKSKGSRVHKRTQQESSQSRYIQTKQARISGHAVTAL